MPPPPPPSLPPPPLGVRLCPPQHWGHLELRRQREKMRLQVRAAAAAARHRRALPLTLPPPLPNPSRPSYYAVDDGSSLGSRPRRQGDSQMMVFDFIRKRAEEGIQQVQNIATKTAVRVLTGT